jgi:hypothetical protein
MIDVLIISHPLMVGVTSAFLGRVCAVLKEFRFAT